MKTKKGIITPSWIVFLIIYVMLFYFSFSSVMVTIDEYDGGDKMVEFGANLFDFFGFPIFTLLDSLNFTYKSNYNLLFITVFGLNLIINCALTTILLDRLFLYIKMKINLILNIIGWM